MPTLEDAILLATTAHRDQLDNAGEPYILHLLTVMLQVKTENERITGVLHDLIEDTPYTISDLKKMGYADEVLEALRCLTRAEGENYMDFIGRVKQNPLARRVKIADLSHNMDLKRINRITGEDRSRLEKYKKAWRELTDESSST